MTEDASAHTFCQGCVYFPPNLPRSLYTDEDWALVQSKLCSFDATPGDGMCNAMRKGACALVNLDKKPD